MVCGGVVGKGVWCFLVVVCSDVMWWCVMFLCVW